MVRPGTPETPGRGDKAREDILALINEREGQIERSLEAAREEAAARIAAARDAAAAHVAAKRSEADRLARAAGEAVIAAARREAETIGEEASREAEAVLGTRRELLEAAADRMLAIVLPGPPQGEPP